MKKITIALLCAALALPLTTLSATAASKSDPRPVTKGFGGGMFTWSKGDDLLYRWAYFNNDGMLEICGLSSTAGRSVGARLSAKAMQEASIRLGNKTMIRGLAYFAFPPNEGRATHHVGELANCKVTKHPYPASPKDLKIKFRKGKYSVSK